MPRMRRPSGSRKRHVFSSEPVDFGLVHEGRAEGRYSHFARRVLPGCLGGPACGSRRPAKYRAGFPIPRHGPDGPPESPLQCRSPPTPQRQPRVGQGVPSASPSESPFSPGRCVRRCDRARPTHAATRLVSPTSGHCRRHQSSLTERLTPDLRGRTTSEPGNTRVSGC